MTETPLVSVVIPAFNVAEYIEQSVRSVLSQTMPDFEIVVVDDGSSDGCLKVVEGIRDGRIRTTRKSNGGCASARNAGFNLSRGKFVAFLDGDDYWYPTLLERLLAVFENRPGTDLVFCLSRIVDKQDKDLGMIRPGRYRSYSFEDLIIDNPVGNGSAAVLRRSVLEQTGPFDEALVASSDCDMWFRIARIRPGNFMCLPEILTCYRRREEQTTGNWRRMREANKQVMIKAREADGETVAKVEHLSRLNRYRYHAFIAYESGELDGAIWLLKRGLNCSRMAFLMDPRSWMLGLAIFSKAIFPERLHLALFQFFSRARETLFRFRKTMNRTSH